MSDPVPPAVNADVTRELANRAGKMHLPVYATDDDPRTLGIPGVPEQCKVGLDAACEEAHLLSGGTVDLEVFKRFINLSHLIPVVRTSTQKDSEEWCFAPLRMCLIGAGWDNWKALVAYTQQRYPECPWDELESEHQWTKSNFGARKMTGWPSVISWIDWQSLVYAYPIQKAEDMQVMRWMKVIALFHTLKHLRTKASSPTLLTCVYRGVAKEWDMREPSSSVSDITKIFSNVVSALGMRKTTPKTAHAPTEALRSVLDLPVRELIPRCPPTRLPLSMIQGPWVRPIPDARIQPGFINHGCRLCGVWKAAAGKVREHMADEFVMGYEWAFTPQTHLQELEDFKAILPREYMIGSPFEVFVAAFPNLILDHHLDRVAIRCLFDAVLIADLWRGMVRTYDREFPLVLLLPHEPTPRGSTNTGKTFAAETIARAIAPGCPTIRAKESTGAPDQRSMAQTVRAVGTVCLDEWAVSRRPTAFLNELDMHTLCTGGSIISGKVMENGQNLVSLRHPIVASSKVADLSDDMQSRALLLWLRDLNREERQRSEVVQRIESGRLSMELRLAAIALAENAAIQHAAKDFGRTDASRDGFRFANTGAIAAVLYQLYRPDTGKTEAREAIDLAAYEMRRRQAVHMEDATSSGVLGMLRSSTRLTLSINEMFSPDIIGVQDLDDMIRELEEIKLHRKVRSSVTSNYFRPKEIWLAWARVRGVDGLGLREQVTCVANDVPRDVSELMIARAMSQALDAYLPEPSEGMSCREAGLPMPFSSLGYVFRRVKNNGPNARYVLTVNKDAIEAGIELDPMLVPLDHLVLPPGAPDAFSFDAPEDTGTPPAP